jgi:hypothetical protein
MVRKQFKEKREIEKLRRKKNRRLWILIKGKKEGRRLRGRKRGIRDKGIDREYEESERVKIEWRRGKQLKNEILEGKIGGSKGNEGKKKGHNKRVRQRSCSDALLRYCSVCTVVEQLLQQQLGSERMSCVAVSLCRQLFVNKRTHNIFPSFKEGKLLCYYTRRCSYSPHMCNFYCL